MSRPKLNLGLFFRVWMGKTALSSARIFVKYAWLFPGQGAQVVGMGRALYEQSSAARDVFDRADAALGFHISRLCFDGPSAELTLTKNTQPAIVATSIAALRAFRELHPGVEAPSFVAGHSLGEYSALVAADALTLEDALRVVHLRGAAMQEAVAPGLGGMAAIMGGTSSDVEALCIDAASGEVLSPANFNSPGQVVIAGHQSAVERAIGLAKERGLKGIPLPVSAPFHCSLMAPAAARVRDALAGVAIRSPRVPVVANVDAQPHTDAKQIAGLLVRQVDGAVLWEQSIRFMSESGVGAAIEFGPGKVLSGLIKRIDKSWTVRTVGAPEDLAPAFQLFA